MLLTFFIWAGVIISLEAHGEERYAGQVYKIISLNGSPTQKNTHKKPTRITTLRANLNKKPKIEETSYFEEPTTTTSTTSTTTDVSTTSTVSTSTSAISDTTSTSAVSDTSSKEDESSTLVLRSIKSPRNTESDGRLSSKNVEQSILQSDFYSQLRNKKSKRHFLTPFQDLIVKKSELFTRAKIVTTSSTTTIIASPTQQPSQQSKHQAS